MTDNTDSTTAVAGIGVFNKSIVPPEQGLQSLIPVQRLTRGVRVLCGLLSASNDGDV
jgi:hypothetical protein